MTGLSVPVGALFYAQSKRRREVRIGGDLRAQVETATAAVRALIEAGKVPPPANDARCTKCSLADLCQPTLRAGAAGLFDPES
jgi:CRISPR-associated exonuclease Cas4